MVLLWEQGSGAVKGGGAFPRSWAKGSGGWWRVFCKELGTTQHWPHTLQLSVAPGIRKESRLNSLSSQSSTDPHEPPPILPVLGGS